MNALTLCEVTVCRIAALKYLFNISVLTLLTMRNKYGMNLILIHDYNLYNKYGQFKINVSCRDTT